MPVQAVKTTYLEMIQMPERLSETVPSAQPVSTFLMPLAKPTLAYYRFLYQQVGKDLFWVDRAFLSDVDLLLVIEQPTVQIQVLYVQGAPAGYFELVSEADSSVRIAYFGLMPEFRGKGLGKYLLDQAIRAAWVQKPDRVWLHTCELDSPAALPTYLKAGFEITHTEIVQQHLP